MLAVVVGPQLGAQVASVPAENVLDGLTRFVTEARATQLIVGKSARSRWFEFVHGSVVDRLVRGTPGIAVHVLPMSDPEIPRTQAPSRRTGNGWGKPMGYLISFGLTALVTLLGLSILAFGNITNIGLLYLLPVMVAATRYGVRTGILTGLASSLAYNFFFIPPTRTFTIQDPQNIITVLVLMGVAIVASQLAARVRDHAVLAQRSAAQNSALAGFSRLLTGVSERQELGQVLCAEIGRLLDASTVLMLPARGELALSAAYPPEDRLDAIELAAAR
ncbi:MAG: DUF4118 domain-containing protein, partial [Alphaproteobacteria bacterium]